MAQTILIYGKSGGFKTSNIGEFIDWLFDRYAYTDSAGELRGATTRAICGDNYGPIRNRIADGKLEVWNLRTTTDPLSFLILAR